MKQATTTTHLDWEIHTVVGIDNPDDWKLGDPDRYFVRGIATLLPDADRFNYTDDEPQIVDGDHFTDESLAEGQHAAATQALLRLINGLRIP